MYILQLLKETYVVILMNTGLINISTRKYFRRNAVDMSSCGFYGMRLTLTQSQGMGACRGHVDGYARGRDGEGLGWVNATERAG